MSVSHVISHRIKRMPRGKPFARSSFAQAGSRAAVDKVLSRMVQSGSLEWVARGVYMRPKPSRFTGSVRPCPLAVMAVITKANGETVQVHGAEAVRRLGLSTQMQVLMSYYTSGSTREVKVGNAVVKLKHVSARRLQQAGTQAGLALTALYYLGRDGVSVEVISKIKCSLSSEEMTKLLACSMPRWMRLALEERD